jgi:hypothetical protein
MRHRASPLRWLSAFGCALTLSTVAHAAEPVGEHITDAQPPLAILPTPPDALVDPSMARSWGTLPARQFWATTVDVGFVYLRPRLSFGYGRPFTEWFGLDANPIAVTNGLGVYGGFRIEVPHVDWRVGPRYFSSFSHTYLPEQPSYTRLDIEAKSGAKARLLTLETELDLSLRLGPGLVLLRGSASYFSGVPKGETVFEETLHVIVAPPFVWRTRLAYVFTFGSHDQHSIGPAIDVLDVPKRDDSTTVRVGPIVRMALSRRVEVRGSFIVTVLSPDKIGLVGGDFTELGVRYRWASE